MTYIKDFPHTDEIYGFLCNLNSWQVAAWTKKVMIERQNSGSGGGGEWMAPPEVSYSCGFVTCCHICHHDNWQPGAHWEDQDGEAWMEGHWRLGRLSFRVGASSCLDYQRDEEDCHHPLLWKEKKNIISGTNLRSTRSGSFPEIFSNLGQCLARARLERFHSSIHLIPLKIK